MRSGCLLLLAILGCSAPKAPAVAGLDAGLDAGADAGTDAGVPEWTALFNGTDFSGWEIYLGPRDGQSVPVGLNPLGQNVFTVAQVDGESAIHVTGEIWGVLATVQEYENFHLRLKFKWGTKAWPPLNFFDSGVMFHSIGPHGAVKAGGGALAMPPNSGWFMQSLECQITPADTGSFYTLGDNTAQNAAHQAVRSIARSADHELPAGQWNTLEIRVTGDQIQHLVNGQLAVAYASPRSRLDGVEGALTRGRIQLQSESGEIFFSKLEIRVLR